MHFDVIQEISTVENFDVSLAPATEDKKVKEHIVKFNKIAPMKEKKICSEHGDQPPFKLFMSHTGWYD